MERTPTIHEEGQAAERVMAKICENCRQPVLDTDTVCWHCGWELAIRSAVRPSPNNELAAERDYPLTSVLLYTVLTALVILAAILVMRSLGQKPLIIIHPETRLSANWFPVTDRYQRFTLDLPKTWRRLDRQDESQQAGFEALLEQNSYLQAALLPLGGVAVDVEPVLLAAGEPANANQEIPPFVIIARSAILAQLSPQEAINLAGRDTAGLDIRETALQESLTGQTQAYLLLDIPVQDGMLRCRQHFNSDEGESFLIAGCTSMAQYPLQARQLQNILDSFQPLSP